MKQAKYAPYKVSISEIQTWFSKDIVGSRVIWYVTPFERKGFHGQLIYAVKT